MEKERFNHLIKRINFDEAAFTEIYTYFFPAVVFSLTRTFRNKELAEDMVQDFFYKKLFKITIPENIEFPLSWILHSCRNLALSSLKKEIQTYEYNDMVLASSLSDSNERQIDGEILSDRNQTVSDEEYFRALLNANLSEDIVIALKELGRDNAEIFVLHYFEKYSKKEIANILKMNWGTLRSKFSRSAKLLKILLQACNILLF